MTKTHRVTTARRESAALSYLGELAVKRIERVSSHGEVIWTALWVWCAKDGAQRTLTGFTSVCEGAPVGIELSEASGGVACRPPGREKSNTSSRTAYSGMRAA